MLVLAIDGDEQTARTAAEAAGVGLAAMGEHVIATEREPALILGYARVGEPALRAAAAALAAALAVRRQDPSGEHQ
jgi:DNA-binding transcriptional MocR family regulator